MTAASGSRKSTRRTVANASREHAAPGLSVSDVLSLDVLGDAEVVAGAGGLDRSVSGVNIVEVPDVWQWLRGGEFLLSSGYAWRDDPSEIAVALRRLNTSGVSALAFKLGQYIAEFPASVIEVADSLNFPLITLPPDVAYRDVFEPLYGRLLAVPGEQPPFGFQDDEPNQWVHLGLDDQSIEKIALGLAHETSRDVLIIDDVDGHVYVATASCVSASRYRQSDYDGELRGLMDLMKEKRLHRRATWLHGPSGQILVSGLVIGRQPYGYLGIAGERLDSDSHLRRTLSQAAELTSFLLLKRLSFLDGRREAGRSFFNALMTSELSNEEATERALAFGIRLSQPSTVAVFGIRDGFESAGDLEVLHRELLNVMTGRPSVVSIETDGRQLHLLIQDDDNTEDLMATILQRCENSPGPYEERAYCAIGSRAVGLDGVRRSRSQAMIAADTAARTKRGGVIRFTDLRVERLLAQIPDTPLSRGYIESLLGGLGEDQTLLSTLEEYLRHGANKSATAAAMYLHRSSLLYRLEKIQATLDIDLNDAEQCQEVWLALRLSRMFGTTPGPKLP